MARTISLPLPIEGFAMASGTWKKIKNRKSMVAKSNATVFIHIRKIMATPAPISAAPAKYVQNKGAPIHFGTMADTNAVKIK